MFFRRHGKKRQKLGKCFSTVWSIDRYYRISVNRWIDSHRSEKSFMIDCRYYRSKIKKSFTDGSITSMKMRPKVSIDSIDRYYRYRSNDPSPIVPIYAYMYSTVHRSRFPTCAYTLLYVHLLGRAKLKLLTVANWNACFLHVYMHICKVYACTLSYTYCMATMHMAQYLSGYCLTVFTLLHVWLPFILCPTEG